MKQQSNFIE